MEFTMIIKTVLDAADAARITAACQEEARNNGWAMSIAVVDDSGRLLSLIRSDGAGYATADVARRKAETAAMNRKSSADAEKMALDRLSMLALNDRLALQGGLAAMKDGQCIGAIGVSGGLSPQDEQVAAAGLSALGL
jgi:glc operon protein GlcG